MRVAEMLRPIAAAVLRLMISSNSVASWIGRSVPGAVEDAVDVTRRALEQDTEIGALGNEPAGRNVFSIWVDGRQPASGQRRRDLVSLGQQERVGRDQDRIRARLVQPKQGALDLIAVPDLD